MAALAILVGRIDAVLHRPGDLVIKIARDAEQPYLSPG